MLFIALIIILCIIVVVIKRYPQQIKDTEREKREKASGHFWMLSDDDSPHSPSGN